MVALVSETVVEMLFQVLPLLVEYSHVPCAAVAALPTMATPAKGWPRMESYWPPVISEEIAVPLAGTVLSKMSGIFEPEPFEIGPTSEKIRASASCAP